MDDQWKRVPTRQEKIDAIIALVIGTFVTAAFVRFLVMPIVDRLIFP